MFFDFDNDGWLDLFLTNQLGPNQLYRNNGDGTFTLSPLSAQVAITDSLSLGASAADFDNDGYRDLFVAVWGRPNALFHNDNGTGFTNVAADAGVANIGPRKPMRGATTMMTVFLILCRQLFLRHVWHISAGPTVSQQRRWHIQRCQSPAQPGTTQQDGFSRRLCGL